MGLIMRDSVPYAGSNDIVLTQAQYDALVQAGEVLPNVNYYISNANHSTPIYASGVHYDNSDSGLIATNLQGAVDEIAPVKTSIGNIDNVTLTTPAVGDTLTWNGSAWVNTSKPEYFWLDFSSSITDLYIRTHCCYYIPATGEVHISFAISSNNKLIPTANNTIATIPEKYRPSAERAAGTVAIVIKDNTYTPKIEAISNIGTDGNIKLGNWIYGATATLICSMSFSYIR